MLAQNCGGRGSDRALCRQVTRETKRRRVHEPEELWPARVVRVYSRSMTRVFMRHDWGILAPAGCRAAAGHSARSYIVMRHCKENDGQQPFLKYPYIAINECAMLLRSFQFIFIFLYIYAIYMYIILFIQAVISRRKWKYIYIFNKIFFVTFFIKAYVF